MSTLVEQMLMDLELMNYSRKTIYSYCWHVKAFLDYFKQEPEALDEDDIRRYLYMIKTEKKMSSSNLAQAFSAIKFLYRFTLKMPMSLNKLRGPGRGHKLPVVLSKQELHKLFDAAHNRKHKTILMTIYAAGLRVSEAAHLKVSDIDSQRMTIRVEQGKGNKDRYTLLSSVLLQQLREYWRVERPRHWLFPSRDVNQPIGVSTIQRVFQHSKKSPYYQASHRAYAQA
jgi:integrase/recombinase XerD